ncbi:endonuclease/exonuclease/phosphatase family protein [Flavobacteriaceae bacterium]|jgi:endonuclease/exonuclease/phosphatase family metal-dependent hydrolase|nr:endonuclease/exonuclease/phosphatase family protein [Flavobacteriaceae bacterium]MBT4297920.1 endonuclease/exonuclease/phosphatase family protein [Flavobacteriaceae bacterium]MBT7574072.1 endonuclease/exonuclease/phosphatase family protein [Flavobacteriaceae bacterium]MDB2427230.1 endonuclease/exonuclease/phosphatase family protein [Flavobacteriaceae bacterium]MDB2568465.1 endonuclease/exonuclease/phosphatase family protein [Flavobacteriaceae bacterium]
MRIFLFIYFLLSNLVSDEIKVISYNVRYNNPNDGKDIWENRRSTIVNLIKNENPDFLGLQEVNHAQLLFLNSNLSNYSFVGVGRDDGKTKGEYSPIFYNNNLFDLIKSDTFWLSSTPDKISVGWDASMERICTYAVFKSKTNKKNIWVFNTHFDHIGMEAREKSADLIISVINKLTEPEDYVVLTGDFNLLDDSKPIMNLQSNFNDTNKNLEKTDKSYGTFNNFKLNFVSKSRIDYVFEKNFKLINSRHIIVKTPEGRWASDHHPILAKLKF